MNNRNQSALVLEGDDKVYHALSPSSLLPTLNARIMRTHYAIHAQERMRINAILE